MYNIPEKKRLLIIKIASTCAFVLIMLFPTIFNACTPIEVLETSAYIDGYCCTVYVTYNRDDLFNDSIVVEFYDSEGYLVGIEECNYSSYEAGSVYSYRFYGLDEYADKYSLTQYSATTFAGHVVGIIIYSFALAIFTIWLIFIFQFCKIYDFGEDRIIVYAGTFHQYIKINGKITDEHKSFVRGFEPLVLNCVFKNNVIKVKISASNFITLKVNESLYGD